MTHQTYSTKYVFVVREENKMHIVHMLTTVKTDKNQIQTDGDPYPGSAFGASLILLNESYGE